MRRPLLQPLVPLYRLALSLRELRLGTPLEPVRRLRLPVISIGGLSAGGSGKTPLTIALAKAFAARGLHVDVLSRGYGRKSQSALRVNPHGSAENFGDEPLLIARKASVPVYVASQRYQAGLLAESDLGNASGPAVHLLDDGFQHRQLHRDVNILLFDARDLSDCLLPAGNLREPLAALHRANIVVIPADNPELEFHLRKLGWQGPIWRIHRQMEIPYINGPAVAFCGIARPDQFFAGLEAAGLDLAARIAFPDHHRYTPGDFAHLESTARATNAAALITTEKDRARLGLLSVALPLHAAQLRVEIENEQQAMQQLQALFPHIT
jgi:tetraacyldisaccharide 4'-kinase